MSRPRLTAAVAALAAVFAVLVLFGSARAFMMPATQAVLVNMVPNVLLLET